MADGAPDEANWLAKPGGTPVGQGPIDANEPRSFKVGAGEDCARQLNEREVALFKTTIHKPAPTKDAFHKSTIFESAVVEFTLFEFGSFQA